MNKMFAVRRIFRSNKQLTNYICTSNILHVDKDKKASNLSEETGRDQKSSNLSGRGKKQSDFPRKDQKEFSKREKKQREYWSKHEKQRETAHKDSSVNVRPSKKGAYRPISREMVSTVEKVASELGGDTKRTKVDLLNYVKTLDAEPESESDQFKLGVSTKSKKLTYKEWLEKEKRPKEEVSRGDRRDTKRRAKLHIFDESIMNAENQLRLNIWDSLKEEELATKSLQAPNNFYEELIKWTNQGRLWKFPIDNDQGLDREAATSFTEHVFLEKHLEPWCPKKGPIKKFMDMVLIGLGKNPYLTVKEKRAHILWFKFYFEEKKKLLKELGAMGPTKLEVSNQETTP